jgi:hypothetical protein
MDFDYKKYSLENLENWMHDAMSSGGASPQEIYDVIVNVVKENYYTYKQQASQAYELLTLLNGNGKGHIKSWDDFWEENYRPEEYKGSTVSSVQYTEEELNAMCDKAASEEEKEQCREYNLREAEYYDKRAKLDMTYQEAIAAGWTMTADGFWMPPQKKDKVKKWVLPVEEAKNADTDETEYFVSFPDDLLQAAKLKEGDVVEWVDNGDGTYTLKKAWEDPYKEEMIAAGYKKVDGRWQHPGLKPDEC